MNHHSEFVAEHVPPSDEKIVFEHGKDWKIVIEHFFLAANMYRRQYPRTQENQMDFKFIVT